MIRVLFHKEFSRLWPAFIMLGFFTWLVVFIAVIFFNSGGTGAGTFAGVAVGLNYMMKIAGIILGHLLIATEYQAKTQLFLSGLPLPRWKMLSVKIFIAFFLTAIYAIGSVLIAWAFANGTELVTPRFLGILISSALGWGLFITGFFLATGFLGRYRLIIYLMIWVTIQLLHNSPIPIEKFPPSALIDHTRFGLEREIWPVFNLQVTGALIVGWILVTYLLGLTKEGSISTMLGEKMSYREKMFIGGTFIIGLALSIPYLVDQPEEIPFDLPDGLLEEWDGVEVKISPETPQETVDLEIDIASNLARRLSVVRDWLGIPKDKFPKVFVIERSDIEEVERIDWEEFEKQNVVKMYAGYRQEEFSANRLLSWTLSQVMRKYSNTRVGHEDRWWIVCGLEGLWEMAEADEATKKEREKLAYEAVKKHGLTDKNLLGWSKYQDDVEWRSADAVAWMGMRFLEQSKGKAVVQTLAKKTVVIPFTRKDGRAVLWDLTHPMVTAFRDTTGMELAEFADQWRDYILSHEPSTKEETE